MRQAGRRSLWGGGCLAGAAHGEAAPLGMSRRAPGGRSASAATRRAAFPSASLSLLSRASLRRAPSGISGPRRLSHCRAAHGTSPVRCARMQMSVFSSMTPVLRGGSGTDLWARATPLRI